MSLYIIDMQFSHDADYFHALTCSELNKNDQYDDFVRLSHSALVIL